MAGYRNRMAYFYHEITPEELYEICRHHIDEIMLILNRLTEWLRNNRDKVDRD